MLKIKLPAICCLKFIPAEKLDFMKHPFLPRKTSYSMLKLLKIKFQSIPNYFNKGVFYFSFKLKYPCGQHTCPAPVPKQAAAVAISALVGVLISNKAVSQVILSASKIVSIGRRSTNTETCGQVLPPPRDQTALEK